MYLEEEILVAKKVYWVASHRKAFLAPSRYALGVCMLHVVVYAKRYDSENEGNGKERVSQIFG